VKRYRLGVDSAAVRFVWLRSGLETIQGSKPSLGSGASHVRHLFTIASRSDQAVSVTNIRMRW